MEQNFEATKEGLTKALETLKHEIARFQNEQEQLMSSAELKDDERAELNTWLSREIAILASALGYPSEQGAPAALIVNWTPNMTRIQGNFLGFEGYLNGSLRDLLKNTVDEPGAEAGEIPDWKKRQQSLSSLEAEQPFDAGDIGDWKKNRRTVRFVGGERSLDAGSIGDWKIRGLILGPDPGKKIQGEEGGE